MERGKFLSGTAALTVAAALLITLPVKDQPTTVHDVSIAWRKPRNTIATRFTNMASTAARQTMPGQN
jgi:hypothetical protein